MQGNQNTGYECCVDRCDAPATVAAAETAKPPRADAAAMPWWHTISYACEKHRPLLLACYYRPAVGVPGGEMAVTS